MRYINLFVIFAAFAISASAQQSVSINFQAVVGDKLFDCRESYAGIGTTSSTITVSDFRFYIQDVRLIDNKGKEVPLKLTNDGKFQSDKVALLDFENGEGNCPSGTKELNTSVVGTAPKGEYKGVKFKIGVPEELNHLDPTIQVSPLNISKLAWSWQMGFKFARIDAKTTGRPNGYVLHLGSTECKTDATTGKTACGFSNRPEFVFPTLDLKRDAITIDLKSLWAGANVDVNQDKTAGGCMSFESDSDCGPVFSNLGLTFKGQEARGQSVFRVQRKAVAHVAIK